MCQQSTETTPGSLDASNLVVWNGDLTKLKRKPLPQHYHLTTRPHIYYQCMSMYQGCEENFNDDLMSY